MGLCLEMNHIPNSRQIPLTVPELLWSWSRQSQAGAQCKGFSSDSQSSFPLDPVLSLELTWSEKKQKQGPWQLLFPSSFQHFLSARKQEKQDDTLQFTLSLQLPELQKLGGFDKADLMRLNWDLFHCNFPLQLWGKSWL